MKFGKRWSRRKFLAVSGAAATNVATELKGLGQAAPAATNTPQTRPQASAAAAPAPGVITGGTQPLMASMTRRPLRYRPEGGDFVIRNGKEFFDRPIYGPPDAGGFRVDAGDLPEFSLYLPGHGGNLKLGFIAADGKQSKWGAQADEVIARYRPGRMIYEMRDALLGKGTLRAELLTMGTGSGLMVKVEGHDLPAGTRLAWAFGGVSGRKGRRGGDIGCETEPVSQFFQVREEECVGNVFVLGQQAERVQEMHLTSPTAEMLLTCPVSDAAAAQILDFDSWTAPPQSGPDRTDAPPPPHPILRGSVEMGANPQFLMIQRIQVGVTPERDIGDAFPKRGAQVETLARTLAIDTPDEYINTAAGNFGIAADALWDSKQGCIMHGAVAWRQAFAGWRGPYCLDALGMHDRAVANFRHWIAKQNVSPITSADPAAGPWDANSHMTRKEKLLHSNGDVENSHYDMNLVLFDALLRHLMWTGDLEFAREVWPALERHLAWERRLFRRTYKTASGKELPLYEAYAAIWASDNLQYSGGGAAHSSAYNIFALRTAAKIAKALGKDGSAYEAEADLIHQGMQELLWIKNQGTFGESKDLLGPQTVYTNPALWTVYHTIDSEVPTPAQARLMATERLAALKHVPIHGDGVPEGDWYMLPCSDWLPYSWSLNLLLLGENMHFALALWQTGMRDEAYRIFKGSLLDSMYMGLCPGDFHMTSALDVHRQEAQRDFGDPTGISSRALIEGLFGVQPDLIAGEIRIRPGFPSDWNRASLKHKDFDFTWKRDGLHESYDFTSRLPKEAALKLRLPARTTNLPVVTSNGQHVQGSFDPQTVGAPILLVSLPVARSHRIDITWHGKVLVNEQPTRVPPAAPQFLAIPTLPRGATTEPIDLSRLMKYQVAEIFTRNYAEPRSEYCSLAFPDTLLGGWANQDRANIDDAGLRAAGGLLKTPINVDFATPAGTAPNCLFLSHWKQDESQVTVPLSGRARGIYLLVAGTTFPQCSRMRHGTVTVTYKDGTPSELALRNPETWWPIEQDYLLDDYLFVNTAPLPPRVDLRTGQTRILDPAAFHGKGRTVPGGAATILHLQFDPAKDLASLQVSVDLYGIVVGVLAATLVRA